ncbi:MULTISPECIES: hypothetical protein [Streptomyces]|uniref:hypothetical protein n=1 Tax=Streptomyces TaxID=1883 RepID=UPI00345B5AEB
MALTVGCVGFAPVSIAQPATPRATSMAADAGVGDDDMPLAIETFQYPDSAKIAQEKGITLHKGDGHILLTDCAGTYDILVKARGPKNFCFAVKGKQGQLTLEVDNAFAIMTEDHPVHATIRVDGTETPIDAPKNGYKAFGEGDAKVNKPAVLLELRVTG